MQSRQVNDYSLVGGGGSDQVQVVGRREELEKNVL